MDNITKIAYDLLKRFGTECIVQIKDTSLFNLENGRYDETYKDIKTLYTFASFKNSEFKENTYARVEGNIDVILLLENVYDFTISSKILINSNEYKVQKVVDLINFKNKNIIAKLIIKKV